MIYLDYAANTPVEKEVLNQFIEDSEIYFGNPNSTHEAGKKANDRMREITQDIAKLLHVQSDQIIYTSGASESNNLAIKGTAYTYRNKGRHIISTCLEHSSVSGALTSLQNQGYEIDLVDILPNGQIDLNHLSELIREDTIMVSVCYVDSELGVIQPVEKISELLKSYKNCFFHVDATQAVGKIPVNTQVMDLMTFAPHKFYGLNGCGVLLRKQGVVLEPLIHGGVSTSVFRSGTPAVALAGSIYSALNIALCKLNPNYTYVANINSRLKNALSAYQLVRFNSTEQSIPHTINLSVKGVKGTVFQKELADNDICVSVKSACSVENAMSRAVYAVTKDKKNAFCSWRISIGYRTTEEEVSEFLKKFDQIYRAFVK